MDPVMDPTETLTSKYGVTPELMARFQATLQPGELNKFYCSMTSAENVQQFFDAYDRSRVSVNRDSIQAQVATTPPLATPTSPIQRGRKRKANSEGSNAQKRARISTNEPAISKGSFPQRVHCQEDLVDYTLPDKDAFPSVATSRQLIHDAMKTYQSAKYGNEFAKLYMNLENVRKILDFNVDPKAAKGSAQEKDGWRKNYSVLEGDLYKHVRRRSSDPDEEGSGLPYVPEYIVPREYYHLLLVIIHKACGHKGRDATTAVMRAARLHGPPKEIINEFIGHCPTCQAKAGQGALRQPRGRKAKPAPKGPPASKVKAQTTARRSGRVPPLTIAELASTAFPDPAPARPSTLGYEMPHYPLSAYHPVPGLEQNLTTPMQFPPPASQQYEASNTADMGFGMPPEETDMPPLFDPHHFPEFEQDLATPMQFPPQASQQHEASNTAEMAFGMPQQGTDMCSLFDPQAPFLPMDLDFNMGMPAADTNGMLPLFLPAVPDAGIDPATFEYISPDQVNQTPYYWDASNPFQQTAPPLHMATYDDYVPDFQPASDFLPAALLKPVPDYQPVPDHQPVPDFQPLPENASLFTPAAPISDMTPNPAGTTRSPARKHRQTESRDSSQGDAWAIIGGGTLATQEYVNLDAESETEVESRVKESSSQETAVDPALITLAARKDEIGRGRGQEVAVVDEAVVDKEVVDKAAMDEAASPTNQASNDADSLASLFGIDPSNTDYGNFEFGTFDYNGFDPNDPLFSF